MDPQELLFVNKRVITIIRAVSFSGSLLLAALAVLAWSGALHVHVAAHWLCLPLAAGIAILGTIQGVWNPYTKRRVLFYVYSYCLLGVLLSIFVLGFSALTFLSWLLLIMAMTIYFDRSVAWVGVTSMLTSLFGWLWINWHTLSSAMTIELLGAGLMAIAIVLVVAAIWRMARDSVNKMQASNTRERVEHEQLTSLINSMADGVIAVDSSMKVVLYNAAALDVLDLNTSLKGQSLHHVIKPINAEGHGVDIVKLVRGTKIPTVNRDLRLRYRDDSIINLYVSVAPVHLSYSRHGHSTEGFVLLLRDITREKSLEEERDEFISVVSHELRTPIAITEGNISNAQFTAQKSGDITVIRKALDGAHEQVMFLAGLVNDLSTLSRAERGVLQVEVEPINVAKLVGELADGYRKQATAKKLKLHTELDPKLKPLSSGLLYTREVLQNFVTNAIKYTEHGSVTIGAAPDPRGVRFYVRDTGIGISRSDQEKIFDKFFRSEDYRTRKNNGTGLGLYVTMKLARLLHAEITVTSELNHGSTFTIFVPDLAADSPKPKARTGASKKHR